MLVDYVGIKNRCIEEEYYDELIKQGFSEEQAMELIKEHGIDIGKISQMNNNTEDIH